MKNLFLISYLLVQSFFLPSPTAFAATNSGQASIGTISRIYLNGNTYFFQLNGVDTCAKKANGYNEYYTFTTTHPNAKSFYALILTSAQSRKPVTIRVATNCTTDGDKEITYIYQDYT